jgi:type VI protein secretion system component VasK
MKINALDIGGEVVKEDDRYVVKDNKTLNNLQVATRMKDRKKSTTLSKALAKWSLSTMVANTTTGTCLQVTSS